VIDHDGAVGEHERGIGIRRRTKTARDGYACSVKELEEGLKAIAAPVRDHTGAVVAALSVSGPAYRFDRQLIGNAAQEVVCAAAAAISHRMGHDIIQRMSSVGELGSQPVVE
jgi:transcriptional regulator